MEPVLKKARITDHFRVALKPQDNNVQKSFKKQKKHQDGGKENILVITIDDDEDDKRQQHQPHQHQRHHQPLQSLLQQQQLPKLQPQPQQKQPTAPPAEGRTTTTSTTQPQSINLYLTPLGIKPSIVDHDRFLIDDIYCEPYYANDSFIYDREQELRFRSRRYFDDELHGQRITPNIRARLIDWLVHLQDSFSLYHESLYMAVKLADQYLMRKTVAKPRLQLLYMTSILIAVKFDERLPPVEISDLLQQTGNIYNREQVISFELDILTTLDFNIRYPLSYGFLRRFARCTRSDQKTLTLARYILESSLLDDEMIEELESKLAAASLLLAYQMLHLDKDWDDTAEFYTGYTQEDLTPLSMKLNNVISRPGDKRISTIRMKYSHSIFLSVARIPPLQQQQQQQKQHQMLLQPQ